MKAAEVYAAISKKPIRAIEWVIATFTALGGIYIFTPLYKASLAQHGLSAFAGALSTPLMTGTWGLVLLIGALLVLYGLWTNKPQVKSVGWFSVILARCFQLLTTILVAGFFPILWIYPMTIIFVVIVLWCCTRDEVRNASH